MDSSKFKYESPLQKPRDERIKQKMLLLCMISVFLLWSVCACIYIVLIVHVFAFLLVIDELKEKNFDCSKSERKAKEKSKKKKGELFQAHAPCNQHIAPSFVGNLYNDIEKIEIPRILHICNPVKIFSFYITNTLLN